MVEVVDQIFAVYVCMRDAFGVSTEWFPNLQRYVSTIRYRADRWQEICSIYHDLCVSFLKYGVPHVQIRETHILCQYHEISFFGLWIVCMFHDIIDAFLSLFDRFTPKALLYLLLCFSTFKVRTVFMFQNPRFIRSSSRTSTKGL